LNRCYTQFNSIKKTINNFPKGNDIQKGSALLENLTAAVDKAAADVALATNRIIDDQADIARWKADRKEATEVRG
jgi:hypothetical protein